MHKGAPVHWQDKGVVLDAVREARDGDTPAARVPMRLGVPWPRGVLHSSDELALRNGEGGSLPVQFRVLETWPDRSIKWLLTDWLAAFGEGNERARFTLVPADDPTGGSSMVRRDGEGAVRVDTTTASFSIGIRPDGGIEFSAEVGDARRADSLSLVAQPTPLDVRFESLDVVSDGPVRATVSLGGRAGSVDVQLELEFFRDSALVRAVVRVRNPDPARHDAGRWPLGADSSVLFEDLSLALGVPGATTARLVTGESDVWHEGLRTSVYQDSSGGERWNCHNHVNRNGEVPLRLRGFECVTDGETSTGLRATPVATVGDAGARVGATVPCFWQNFPKHLVADVEGGVRIGLFPGEFADLHELQGGEQKHHEVWFDLDADVDATALRVLAARPVAVVDPRWVMDAHVVHFLEETGVDSDPRYEALVGIALDEEVGFAAKREAIDEYGWRNFGDLYADHEAHFHEGEGPFVSHYNNQYDGVYGCGLQFLRSGDPRWFRLMGELAEHVRDIDVYHTRGDRWGYNLGMFWHSLHYQEAGTASHRTYGPGDGNAGGGPSPEHLYPSGLALHYRLSGAEESRRVAVDLGEYVIGSDDGRLQRYALLDAGPTGYVSASGSEHYHGPGRAPGNCLVALMEAFRLSGERRFLDKADELIRRVIHPADDIAERNLPDIENRWYYMVFLHALAKYLELKEELGEADQRYAYARAALLHYVRWAAENEYPYLEKPERLEFPTETWAAQEMRKSEVFYRASRHVQGEERERFIACAERFHEASLAQLVDSPTRHYARPVSLMLTFGVIRGAFAANGVEPAPAAPALEDVGAPIRFVSQKFRFLRRAKLIVAAGGVAVVMAVVAVAWLVI